MPSSPEEMQVLPLIDSDNDKLILPDSLAISVNPKNVLLSTPTVIMDGLDHHRHNQTLSSIPSNPPSLPLSQNNLALPSHDLLPVPPAFNCNPKPPALNGPRQSLSNATCTAAAPSTPPRRYRAMPSNNSGNAHSSVSIDSRSSPASTSDSELGSASEEAYDAVTADAPVVSVNEIGGPCGRPNPNANNAGGNVKRQRGTGPDEGEGDDRAGFGVRKNQVDSHSPPTMAPRPSKKARIDDSNVVGDAHGLRIIGSRDGVGEDAPRDRNDIVQLTPRTRTPVRERERESEADRQNSLVGTPPRMSASPSLLPPLPRPPPPTRFQSSSSSSTLTSGSPFPKTPPPYNHANGPGSGAGSPPPATSSSFSSSNGALFASAPQQFWFEDGDLVLLVSSPGILSEHARCSDPFAPSPYANAVSDTIHVGQEAAPSGPMPFRIHASRLALASRAFASLLSTKLPQNPSKEDSARAAREIAARLNECWRNGLACEPFYHAVWYPQMRNLGVDGEYEYEVVGGCPAIRLVGDSPKDWLVALEAIYEPMSFQVRPIVFDALGRALWISTRYGVNVLREWSLTQLRTTWPAQVERMSPVALPHAADAIVLARSCDVPDILPAAFYALSLQRWRPAPVHRPSSRAVSAMNMSTSSPMTSEKPNFAAPHSTDSLVNSALRPNHDTKMATGFEHEGTDGGRAHRILDPVDLRRLIVGREALQDVLVEIVANPLAVGRVLCDDEESCGFGGGEKDMHPSLGLSYPSPSSPSPPPKVESPATGNGGENGAVNTSVGVGALMSGTPSPALSNSTDTTETTLVPGPGGMAHNRPAPQSFPSSFTSTTPSSSNPYFPGLPPSHFASDSSCSATSVSRPSFTFCSPETSKCRTALEALWRSRLVSDGKRPFGTWLARELHRLAMLPRGTDACAAQEVASDNGITVGKVDGTTAATTTSVGAVPSVSIGDNTVAERKGKAGLASEVCASCWEENRRLALWRLDRLCEAIPRMFML